MTTHEPPSFSSFEAVAMFGDNKCDIILYDGWALLMDGPMMSPSSAWSPQAVRNGAVFYVAGDEEEITVNSVWSPPYDAETGKELS